MYLKKFPSLAHYNFDITWTNLDNLWQSCYTEKINIGLHVGYVIFPSHLINAFALPGKTQKGKNHTFYLNML